MDVAPSCDPQRVGEGYIATPPGGGIHTIKIRARLAQDLVGLPKLAVLAFQSLQLCRHIRGNTGAHTTVALELLHPLMQRSRRAADLGGDRRDRPQREACSPS